MHLWRTAPLVEKLARDELSAEQKAYYLLGSLLIWVVATYSGFVAPTTTPWSLPYVAEALAVIAINVVGVVKAFDASGGNANQKFITEFTCLYVPVSISALVVAWGIYWVLRVAFHESLQALSESHFQFAVNLGSLGIDMFAFLAFTATIAVQVITFTRLISLLAAVRAVRSDA